MISQDGQAVSVGTGLHDLCLCVTPIVPELGGGRQGENPLVVVIDGPVSIHADPRPGYTLLLSTQLAT
jgi:hypothetical protein